MPVCVCVCICGDVCMHVCVLCVFIMLQGVRMCVVSVLCSHVSLARTHLKLSRYIVHFGP